MIEKKDLEHIAWYQGRCRNAEYAKWNEDMNCFLHWQYEAGETFVERIRHPDDEQWYDVFIPMQKVDRPDHIKEI